MTTEVIATAKSRLKQEHLTFSDQWFDECIEWLQRENIITTRTTVDTLIIEVKDQWKDANLEIIGAKCLPPRLAEQACVTLRGKYCLQVNAINDVGDSAYNQWKKIKKLENENTNVEATDSTEFKSSWAPTARRGINLSMTDGVQNVFGFEHTSIPELSLDLKPGVKIFVNGPVECRRGQMLLKPINVKIFGGEVESLFETNSVEQELQRRLHPDGQQLSRPPTRPKYQRPPSPPSTRPAMKPIVAAVPPSNSNNSWKPPPKVNNSVIPSSSSSRPKQNTNNYNTPSSSSKKNSFNPPPSTKPKMLNIYSKPEPIPDDDDDDPFFDGEDDIFMEIDESTLAIPATVTPPIPQQPQSSKAPKPAVVDLLDDDDDFDYSGLDGQFTPEPPPSKKKLLTVSKSPYQYIKFIKDNIRNLPSGETVFVKACVATLVSSVKIENGQWTLTVSLNDGSGFLEARMITQLLERIIGFSPNDMKRMKASADSKVKARIINGMSGLSTTLVHMNGIFGIKIEKPNPIIVSFNDIESRHVAALKSRLRVLI